MADIQQIADSRPGTALRSCTVGANLLSRRKMLGGTVVGAAALALASCSSKPSSAPATSSAAPSLAAAFGELDAKIEAGMKAYAIPGVAVAVWAGGQEYVKGYGVTNIDHPTPIDGDTIFRIG